LKIKLHYTRSNNIKELNIRKGSTVEDLLKRIKIKPDTVVIIDKNKPIPIDDELYEGQNLTILQVSSGG
jgi:sulfur carrier protein ThiS